MISIVIPTYNESEIIGERLAHLENIITPDDELIVVDGMSDDNTADIVRRYTGVTLIISQRARSMQMNAGAEAAGGNCILFLHADVLITEECIHQLREHIGKHGSGWGWFTFKLDSDRLIYRVFEAAANLRNRVTGVPLGDHGIFVSRELFKKTGGYPEIPIMEEIGLVKKLKRYSPGEEIKTPVRASARRFEKGGIWKITITMLVLRIMYCLGISPAKLARFYKSIR